MKAAFLPILTLVLGICFAFPGSASGAVAISRIADRTTSEDVAIQVAFTVSGAQRPDVSATSDNLALFSGRGIALSGGPLAYTLTLTPAANREEGTARITVTAIEGRERASVTFSVTVRPVNDPPTVTDIAGGEIDEDKTFGPAAFSIGDIDTPLSQLSVTTSSTNEKLIPLSGIKVDGTGASRTVSVTPLPNQAGSSATIGIHVSDGEFTTSTRFTLAVRAVNDPPAITPIADLAIDEDSATSAIPFTVSDVDSASTALTVTARTSNASIVSPNGIAIAVVPGAVGVRTVQVTPLPNQFGDVVITIVASDGSATSEEPFTLRINPINDGPSISSVPDQKIDEDTEAGPIPFTVDDIDTPLDRLQPTATSTDQTIVPNGNIVFGGSGRNRTVSVKPLPDRSGNVTISIGISDGSLATGGRFNVFFNPVNDPPVLSKIADQVIDQDTSTPTLFFSLTDIDSSSTALSVRATSSNPTLVSPNGIALGGAGAERTIRVTPLPKLTGVTTITLLGTDGSATTESTFLVTVRGVNSPPTISDIANRSIDEDGTTGAIAFTVGDLETAAGSLTIETSSSNTALVPGGNVVLGGSGASRTVTVTPLADQFGTTTITVKVGDGALTAQDSFVVEVKAVNDSPTISDIPNQGVQAGSSAGPILFTVGDADGALDTLKITASTSNPNLIPLTGISIGGSGNNRSITLTPVGTQAGVSTIKIVVSDGFLEAQDSFELTVSSTIEAPKILAGPENSSVDEGDPIAFRVSASGTGPFRYQWQLNGRDLADGTEQTYSIRSASAGQAGNYVVRVSNAAGSATSSSATLAVFQLDYGDAPDGTPAISYPTLRSRDGARHVLQSGFFLGSTIDSETDARVSVDATGDDKGGSTPDDEDGVEFLTQPFVAGQSAQIRITLPSTAGNGGRIDAFVDFNRDGSWASPGERVLSGQAVVPGPNTLVFTVPADAKEGETFARVRLSREGNLGPTGRATNGEVEDYLVRVGTPLPSDDLDFGDAPESSLAVLYRTRFANNGPRHKIVAGFHLGKLVDAERDGQPNADATGDDAIPSTADDEDGVQFASAFEPGKPATLIVTSSSQGILDAWFDFNRASAFEASERGITRFPLVPGPNTIVVNVPVTAVPGATFARFRLTRNGIETPDHPGATAPPPDGEVEDYQISILEGRELLDFGDAPEAVAGTAAFGYPTLLSRNGARHVILPGFFLGKTIDAEADGQPNADASGDDAQPKDLDDEDGVEFVGPVVAGQTARVTVTASQSGRLDAWMDFNANRSWAEQGEQIFQSTVLAAGENSLAFQVPASAKGGATFARFRLSKEGKLGFVGQARDGEVEDYLVRVQGSSPCDVNYKGREFWLAFPGNYPQGPDSPLRLTLCIVGPQGITGTVTGPRFSRNFTLPASMVVEVVVPDSASLGDLVDVVTTRGIHVEASAPVAVYGLNRIPYSSDGYLGLPVEALGREYIVAGYPNVFSSVSALNGTQLAVVATEDETTVTVIPSRDILGHPKGEPFDVPMKRGQTYQLRDPEDATADLSGTEIHSDKPVAVFGGHQCANIDGPSKMFCDHLVEQLMPVKAWGRIFFAVPFATRSGGDVVRVLGTKDNTQLFVNGADVGVVQRGRTRTFSLSQASRIDATQPVFVSQFSRSSDHDDVKNADPFMVTVPPQRFYTRDHMICTGPSALAAHYVNIVAPSLVVGTLTLDGVVVPGGAFTPIGASGFSSARINVTPGPHALSATQPFGSIVYGFGPYEGYGWPGGMFFGDIEPPVIVCPKDFSVNASPIAGTAANVGCGALVPDLRPQVVVSDNCELPTQRVVTQLPAPGTRVGIGEHEITLSARDAAGNEAECQVTMTVVDSGTPALFCPQDMTVRCNKGSGATVAFQVIARTDCGTLLPVECTPASGSLFQLGTTPVVCRVKGFPDRTCTFKVIVVCPPPQRTGSLEGGPPRLAWSGDSVLETALDPEGPWTPVPAAVSPFDPAIIGDRQFFRLRPSDSGTSPMSRATHPILRLE